MQTLMQIDNCFCQYQFWYKNVNFVEKYWNFERNVDLFMKCALLLKVIIFLQNMPIFLVKCDVLCEGLYTLTKCQILIKNFNFLGYVNLYMC